MLPQAKKLELEGKAGGFDYELASLGSDSVAQPTDHYAQGRHISIPEQECDIAMRLPSDDDEDGGTSGRR